VVNDDNNYDFLSNAYALLTFRGILYTDSMPRLNIVFKYFSLKEECPKGKSFLHIIMGKLEEK
jgi:hypothetical protein